MKKPSPNSIAVLQALLVTFLWSTSWVLIKIGLVDIPALTFAGLRYCLAFCCLLPIALRPASRSTLSGLTRGQWAILAFYGLLFYTLVQGAQFVGLAYLPAATVSLILNFTPTVVALMGVIWLSERPGYLGWGGVALAAVGSIVFFYPVSFSTAQAFGILVMVIGMLANAGSSVLGRYINRREGIPALLVTTVSMGIGGSLLLLTGSVAQGIPCLGLNHWAIIAWLALVNTAFAFTLWNQTLRTLTAMESSLINSTMLIQIALLAWFFLGETLSAQKWVGMLLAGLGTAIVQFGKQRDPGE